MTDFQPVIRVGDILKKGLNSRVSENFKFMLMLLDDGFLAVTLFDENNNSIWKVGEGRGHMLTLQEDGNLVLFDVDDNIIWQTNTKGSGIKGVMRNDGKLVLITPNNSVIWESGTAQSNKLIFKKFLKIYVKKIYYFFKYFSFYYTGYVFI